MKYKIHKIIIKNQKNQLNFQIMLKTIKVKVTNIETKISRSLKIFRKMILNSKKFRRFKFRGDYLIMEQIIFGQMKF